MTEPQRQPPSFGARLLVRWESLPARRQLALAYPIITFALLAVHVAFFHRITLWRSIGYSIGEGVLLAGFVVLATQGEIARRNQHDD